MEFQLLRLALQNELTPNQAKVTVKQIARMTRPEPTVPAWYLAYSRAKASPPMPDRQRKTNPVTSSHNIPSIRPNDLAVTFRPLPMAVAQRLFPTCRPATLATIPSFRRVETLITRVILTVCGGTITHQGVLSRKPCDRRQHPMDVDVCYDSGVVAAKRGICGSGTQKADERAGRGYQRVIGGLGPDCRGRVPHQRRRLRYLPRARGNDRLQQAR